jgi:hypothetical protein
MDARVFFHFTDAIATADNAAELGATEDLIRATAMTRAERRALERAIRSRETTLGAEPEPVGARDRATTPLSTDGGRVTRTDQVAAGVAARLRGVCSNLPDDEFAALVARIAAVTVKYDTMATS